MALAAIFLDFINNVRDKLIDGWFIARDDLERDLESFERLSDEEVLLTSHLSYRLRGRIQGRPAAAEIALGSLQDLRFVRRDQRDAGSIAGSGAAPSTATAAACVPSSFGIALDIGHDRAHPGAIGASGTPEFEYNQLLGRAAVAALRNAGFATAFLIEERGTPLGIEERTRIAAERHAALLLSLHHDSVQPRYLSERTVAGRPQRFSDLFHGFSIFVSGRNAHAKQSERFADLLAQALLTRGLTPSLHHAQAIPGENRPLLNARLGVYRFDDLVILAGASMPAALLESGVIVNRAEEQAIRQGSYHEAVVAAVVQAVGDFCRRGPGGR